MTKRTPAPPEAGPTAPDGEEQDALLRRLLGDVTGQPPSPQDLEIVDRLADAVAERIAGQAGEDAATAPGGAAAPASAPVPGTGSQGGDH